MKKTINIGVIGYANIAKRSIIPELLKLTDYYNLVAVSTSSKEKFSEITNSINCNVYDNYELIINNVEIDAVYIPLPNSLHYDWIKKALLSGKHVLVEKSMGLNTNEVHELNMLASENKLVLVENFQFRFHSQLKTITQIIENKSLGEIRNINSYFGFPPFKDKNNIRYQNKLGGGSLLDAGAYPIKIAQLILGNSINVVSASLFYDNNLQVDIWGGGTLKCSKSNRLVQIGFGFDNFYRCSIEIWFSKGYLKTDRIFTAPTDYTPTLFIEDNNGNKEITLNSDNHFRNMLIHFSNLINFPNENLLEIEYEQNRNQSRLIEEFYNKANE